MTTYVTTVELQSVVGDKFGRVRREGVRLSPKRRDGLRQMARAVMSLIF